MTPNPSGTCKLSVCANPNITQDKLWALFNLMPGLEHCELHSGDETGERVYGTVVYNSPKAAAYALEKLHGFDYPFGSRLLIKFEEEDGGYGSGNGFGNTANMPADV